VEDPTLENNLSDEDDNNSSHNNKGEGEVDDTGSGTIGGIVIRLSVNASENLGWKRSRTNLRSSTRL
jgi:hypothetical protein